MARDAINPGATRPNSIDCVTGAVNRQMIADLQRQSGAIFERMEALGKSITQLRTNDLEELKKIIYARPSWAVLLVITILSTSAGGLLIALLATLRLLAEKV